MKTNRKIALLSIATVLSCGILAGSIALYTNLGEGGDIIINGSTETSSEFTLTKGEIGTGKISPTSKIVHNYTLGLNKTGDFKQNVAVSDIELSLKVAGLDSAEAFKAFLADYTVDVDIAGYNAKSFYLSEAEKAAANGIKHFDILDGTYADGAYSVTLTNVYFKDNQNLALTFGMKEGASTAEIKKHLAAGPNIAYDLTVKAPSKFNYAYLRGSFGGVNYWGDSEKPTDLTKISGKFAMVPNIDAENFEWIYEGLEVKAGDAFKVAKSNDEGNAVKWIGNDKDGGKDFTVKEGTEPTTISIKLLNESQYIVSDETIFTYYKPAPVADMKKIYVDWNETANTLDYSNAYLYKGDVNNHAFPGLLMTKVADYKALYEFDADFNKFDTCIFVCGKDSGIKTVNIPLSGYKAETPVYKISKAEPDNDGKKVFSGSWVALDSIEKVPQEPAQWNFDIMASANGVLPLTENGMYCYLWKDGEPKTENAPFPGVKMEVVEPKFQTYGLKDIGNVAYDGCIFSDGTSNNQTINTFTLTKNPTRGFTYKITGKQPDGKEAGHFNGILVDLNVLLEANNG